MRAHLPPSPAGRRLRLIALAALSAAAALLAVAPVAYAQTSGSAQEPVARIAQTGSPVLYSNPVVAGDHPDPTITRFGRTYWAITTTSNWAPAFNILRSSDLVNWQQVGGVFRRRPAWSDGMYWAPEVTQHNGQFYLYYTAHRKGGNLCIAVATAARPQGPYTDHGPVTCDGVGAIDAYPVRDENDRLHLTWKDDGNAVNQPTPIYAQQLSEDGLRTEGDKHELFRNDAPWEGPIVEGPTIVRRGEYFYMLYSGGFCCTQRCTYAQGVARAKKLIGPWEKYSGNPILKSNANWQCAGHASLVTDGAGRDQLLYHGYHPRGSVWVGRQALLDEVKFEGEWPTINRGQGPSRSAASPFGKRSFNAEHSFFDNFTAGGLRPGWQWPQDNEPLARLEPGGGGRVVLSPRPNVAPDRLGAILARSTTVGDYVARTAVSARGIRRGGRVGLAAYGWSRRALGIAIGDGNVDVWQRGEGGVHRTLFSERIPAGAPVIHLRMTATRGFDFFVEYSGDGRRFKRIGPALNGAFLPPFDLGTRVALTAGGAPGTAGVFHDFSLRRVVPAPPRPARPQQPRPGQPPRER